MDKRQLAIEIAWMLYGQPYVWGGDDPVLGFDCSGAIVEIYKSVGVLPHGGDWNGDSLYQRFKPPLVSAQMGAMAAYGTPNRITHVMLCLDAEYVIGATGGGSGNTPSDPTGDQVIDRLERILWMVGEKAADTNAFVKVRPLLYRDDLRGIVDPFQRPL